MSDNIRTISQASNQSNLAAQQRSTCRNFPRSLAAIYRLSPVLLLLACGPSLEDNLGKLGQGGEAAEEAKHNLLLLKTLPLEELLAALEDPRHAAARLGLVDVLTSLMMRNEDPRLLQALQQRLRADSNPQVRARIIYQLSMRKQTELLEDFFVALQDTAAEVRYQAITALSQLRSELNPAQNDTLRQRALQLAEDKHEQTRLQAWFLRGDYVSESVDEARQLAQRAQAAVAESLLTDALAYFPASKKANYRLGRHYFDHGEQERGLQLLRQNSMLLEVPQLALQPTIDGHLDEQAWAGAAVIDTFYQFISRTVFVTTPSKVRTKLLIGYTQDAIYLAAHCYDAHPESLVVKGWAGDYPRHDQMEFILDGNLDYSTFGQIVVNSTSAITSAWTARTPVKRFDVSFNPDVEAIAYVGEDFWSVECRIKTAQQGFPVPQPGDIWGFNAVRRFRSDGISQWLIDFRDGSWYADKFGFLLFK